VTGSPLMPPLGLRLARTARVVTQAFERAMAEAGGSASAWQVLLLVRSGRWGAQARMAEAMGITGATLTHHLNALEAQGLVRRWRDDANRRVQRAELTDEGAALFDRLREVALRHDARLRSRLSDEDVARLAELLDTLEAGLASGADDSREAGPPSRADGDPFLARPASRVAGEPPRAD
jgi:MarR family transcriptional regulator, transcriptional regulator for hemolysin